MLKKAIACLLVLAGVCSFHTSAADSKNEQFVNVNVFNKVYYGTVTKNADAGEAIFTPAGKSADFLQIEGRWDDDAFSGDCVIIMVCPRFRTALPFYITACSVTKSHLIPLRTGLFQKMP